MTPHTIPVTVTLDSGDLTVMPHTCEFRPQDTIVWQPPANDTTTKVQGIAVQIQGTRLPGVKVLSIDPDTGQLTARIPNAQKSGWNYFLLVNGDWYLVAGDGSAKDEPEEPPELVNGGGDPMG